MTHPGGRSSPSDRRTPGLARPWRALVGNDDGGAAVEFGIIAPFFCMLLLGIFEFGFVFSNYLYLTNSVIAGAQTISVSRGVAIVANPASGPYTNTLAAVTAAAPTLTKATLTANLIVAVGKPGVTPSQCIDDSSCQTALTAAMGGTATVSLTYPCNLTIMGVNYYPNCKLGSKVAQVVQ